MRRHVRAEQQERERRRRANAASSVNRWLPPPAEPRRIRGAHEQVDEQADQRHRGGQMRRDGLPGVPEPHRLLSEPRLEPDEQHGRDRRPAGSSVDRDGRGTARTAIPRISNADQRRHGSVDPLDPDVVARVEARQELAREAARPRRAGDAGARRANGNADHDEHERGGDGRGSEPLETGQRSSGMTRAGFYRWRPRGYARSTMRAPSRPPGTWVSSLARRVPAAGAGRLAPARPARPRAAPRARTPSGTASCQQAPPSPTTWTAWAPRRRRRRSPLIIDSPGGRTCGRNRLSSRSSMPQGRPVGGGRTHRPRCFYDLGRDPRSRSRPAHGTSSGRSRTSAASTPPM